MSTRGRPLGQGHVHRLAGIQRGSRQQSQGSDRIESGQKQSNGGSPIIDAFVQSPLVFLLGTFTGLMALDTRQEPIKTWIDLRSREYHESLR